MFDELLRELQKLEGITRIPVSISVDDNGYLDRLCPSQVCHAEFKVYLGDWKDKVHDEAAYCPICRHEAPATDWNTPAQRQHFANAACAHLQGVIGRALSHDARKFNSRQPRAGLITMSMSYRPGPKPILLPPDAAQVMRQQFTCEACGCRYSSVGAAFFCPACGHNSALTTFASAVAAVRTVVATLQSIQAAVAAAADPDAAADATRQILENQLVKLVGSFQRYAEAVFHTLPNAASFKVRKNLFQNLPEASRLWKQAIGQAYEDLLTSAEMADLALYFQQRHLLEHQEGIVDQDYIAKSGDLAYAIGQKLVIKEAAVERLAHLVQELGSRLSVAVRTQTPASTSG